MPSTVIESYLLASDAAILHKGTFRKKSRDFKLWKSRRFDIRDDGILLTYDQQKDIATDIVNITHVKISSGSIDNLDKSGSVDFSISLGVSIVIQAVNYDNMEVVFDSKLEAENFCSAILRASRAIDMMVLRYSSTYKHCNIYPGVRRRNGVDMSPISHSGIWQILCQLNHGVTTIDKIVIFLFPFRQFLRSLSKSCDADVIHSARFIKRSMLLRNSVTSKSSIMKSIAIIHAFFR